MKGNRRCASRNPTAALCADNIQLSFRLRMLLRSIAAGMDGQARWASPPEQQAGVERV